MVGHVVRRGRLLGQLAQFELLVDAAGAASLGPSYAAVALFADLARPRHGPYRLDVLLGVAIQSAREEKEKKLFLILV